MHLACYSIASQSYLRMMWPWDACTVSNCSSITFGGLMALATCTEADGVCSSYISSRSHSPSAASHTRSTELAVQFELQYYLQHALANAFRVMYIIRGAERCAITQSPRSKPQPQLPPQAQLVLRVFQACICIMPANLPTRQRISGKVKTYDPQRAQITTGSLRSRSILIHLHRDKKARQNVCGQAHGTRSRASRRL